MRHLTTFLKKTVDDDVLEEKSRPTERNTVDDDEIKVVFDVVLTLPISLEMVVILKD